MKDLGFLKELIRKTNSNKGELSMTAKDKLLCLMIAVVSFSTIHGMYAQQNEYFINPNETSVGVEINQRADFTQYDYAWEVINNFNYPVISRRTIKAPPQVRERFITSHNELNSVRSNIDEIPIRWNGRGKDDDPVEKGRYTIIVYETHKNNTLDVREIRYPVTVITEKISFEIDLDSEIINRQEGQHLICRVVPNIPGLEEVQAYRWRVIIQNSGSIDNTIVAEQPFYFDQDAPFPGFNWNSYGGLGSGNVACTITVEATDRAGIKSSRSRSFWITDDEIRSASLIEARAVRQSTTPSAGASVSDEQRGRLLRLLPDEYVIYVVKRGDYLAKIASEFYGSAPLWGLIYELNISEFPDPRRPSLILPGMQLLLPSIDFVTDLRNSTQR